MLTPSNRELKKRRQVGFNEIVDSVDWKSQRTAQRGSLTRFVIYRLLFYQINFGTCVLMECDSCGLLNVSARLNDLSFITSSFPPRRHEGWINAKK